MDSGKINIAVIGKSASGKSAFIKSFSNNPEVISSEGKGQTTRSYAEYDFYISNNLNNPRAYIKLLSGDEFVGTRTQQFMNKLKNLGEQSEISIKWLKEQIEDEDYIESINEFVLYSNDFFNIEEFKFLDDGQTIINIKNKYTSFLKIFTDKDISDINIGIDIKTIISILEESNKLKSYVQEESSDVDKIEELFNLFFGIMYKDIVKCIEDKYRECDYFRKENGIYEFEFEVTEELKDELTLFLKVFVDDETKERRSLTGMVSKVNIKSKINDLYLPILKDLNIEKISLLDTYGLDHDDSCSQKTLEERYNRIFNKDYPDITNIFFVEALHSGSSNDFTKAINTLYSERPNIMTYIIGTYVDTQDENILNKHKDWLCSLGKNIEEYPKLNGKVIDYVFEKKDIMVNLKRNNVHPTLAKKRMEIMRKRFGLFCGKEEKVIQDSIYKDINLTTIESIFGSIVDKEHLGEEYINIDELKKNLQNKDLYLPFLKELISYSTVRFQELYSLTASRTKGKIKKNLENYILGFDGSTIDTTWFRVMNDSYNKVFTKQICINKEDVSLSSRFNLIGNEKIAFDELLNTFFPYLFSKLCDNEQPLSYLYHEIDCKKCNSEDGFDTDCIWGMLINAVGDKEFNNRSNYDRVYDWLLSMHKFKYHCKDEFFEKFAQYFYSKMIVYFIPLCREHNIKIAKKKIRGSKESYQETKYLEFCEYKKGYDSKVEIEKFFDLIN